MQYLLRSRPNCQNRAGMVTAENYETIWLTRDNKINFNMADKLVYFIKHDSVTFTLSIYNTIDRSIQ